MKRIISMILILAALTSFCACGTSDGKTDGIEDSEIPKDWDAPVLSQETTVHEMSYLAPSNWRSAEATSPDGWYYYPYKENTDGILYVCCSEKQLIGLDEMQDSIKTQAALLSILKGMKGESEAYNDSYTTVSGYPALVAYYQGELVAGTEYEHKVCVILTHEKVYAVIAAEPGVLGSYFEACMDELVASISLPVLPAGEVEKENEVEEEKEEITEPLPISPIVFEGNGDEVITDVNLQDGRYKVHIVYSGDGVFSVFGYDADDDMVLMESSYGACEKYEVLRQAKFPIILEITSDDSWKIEFEKID